jgi:glycogen debranching enzyme
MRCTLSHHLYARDILSMPDKWEFPYFCSWDSSFHCVCLSKIDPNLAKRQLVLFLREWYMHRNGQLPAYEFAFSDVNPPVHPWAVWRVYRLPEAGEKSDREFLERAFQKLLLNFTWWINREDRDGNNLFAGGFLGLDNVGIFDRSKPLPTGGTLLQADGTAWMAFYCVHMLSMALELARADDVYQDLASKFLEHFDAISHAVNGLGGSGLWDEEDGFYYDRIELDGKTEPLRVRSIVGFIPMMSATIVRSEDLGQFADFVRRAKWDARFRPEQLQHSFEQNASKSEYLLSVVTRERLERLLQRLFDENDFLSPFGIRSMSRFHEHNPIVRTAAGASYSVDYEPGEGTTGMFGGNSNWRGPVWFPVNYLILESLRIYHLFYGESLRIEFPTHSGNWMTFGEAARNLAHRLQGLFLADAAGRRPCNGAERHYAEDPHWKSLLLFYEYYHADTGRGCGASHQTGWTALIADLMNLEPHWTASTPGFIG